MSNKKREEFSKSLGLLLGLLMTTMGSFTAQFSQLVSDPNPQVLSELLGQVLKFFHDFKQRFDRDFLYQPQETMSMMDSDLFTSLSPGYNYAAIDRAGISQPNILTHTDMMTNSAADFGASFQCISYMEQSCSPANTLGANNVVSLSPQYEAANSPQSNHPLINHLPMNHEAPSFSWTLRPNHFRSDDLPILKEDLEKVLSPALLDKHRNELLNTISGAPGYLPFTYETITSSSRHTYSGHFMRLPQGKGKVHLPCLRIFYKEVKAEKHDQLTLCMTNNDPLSFVLSFVKK